MIWADTGWRSGVSVRHLCLCWRIVMGEGKTWGGVRGWDKSGRAAADFALALDGLLLLGHHFFLLEDVFPDG